MRAFGCTWQDLKHAYEKVNAEFAGNIRLVGGGARKSDHSIWILLKVCDNRGARSTP